MQKPIPIPKRLTRSEINHGRGTISTKDLLDQPVYDLNGDAFGRLGEIVIEVERGMTAYVVIECDDDRQCALPFEMVQIDTDPPRLRAAVHRDVFLGT